MAPKFSHEIPLIFMAFTMTLCSSIGASGATCNLTSINDICKLTLFPTWCHASLGSILDDTESTSGDVDLPSILKKSVLVAMNAVSNASLDFSANGAIERIIADKMPNDKLALSALESCRLLLSLATESIYDSVSSSWGVSSSDGARNDVRAWMSAAGTALDTCTNEFDGLVYDVSGIVREKLNASAMCTSNSLAIATAIDSCLGTKETRSGEVVFPSWLTGETKSLFDKNPGEIKADLVVAQDGSGNYTRISDALEAVPERSKARFVVYVKKGTYYENVRVEKRKWNVKMIGDGMHKTIVSGNRSVADGHKTFLTATFAVFGKGFIGQRMAFRNTARSTQAVALLSDSDKSVFFQCLADSRQDTLYVHSKRQFFRECHVSGTMDFIFGNAAVVIQKSLILPKNPSPGRTNVITAQGKADVNDNTGISMQHCTIKTEEDLSGARTFLGRPWRNYSTVVIMESWMDSLIDPEGWLPWNGQPTPSTIFYAEYGNEGPGANADARVDWDGVKVKVSRDDVVNFTARYLIDAEKWLPETGVPVDVGFLS